MQKYFFDYRLNSSIFDFSSRLEVEMLYNIVGNFAQGRFVVKPILANGVVSVYDPAVGEWVAANDLWTSMPVLAQKMRVRMNSMGVEKSQLSFEIMDTKTTQIYKTPPHMVWNNKTQAEYIAKINESLQATSSVIDAPGTLDLVEESGFVSAATSTVPNSANLVPAYLLWAIAGVFVVCIVIGWLWARWREK